LKPQLHPSEFPQRHSSVIETPNAYRNFSLPENLTFEFRISDWNGAVDTFKSRLTNRLRGIFNCSKSVAQLTVTVRGVVC
jgi:hypothetical protein